MATSEVPVVTRTSHAGGTAAILGAALFLVVVIPLHFLQPGYDPSTQLMSELALGRYGGTMVMAFGGLALSVFGIQASAGALGATKDLRGVLMASSLLFLASGLFPLGSTSEIHIAAVASAFVLSVLAMYLFPTRAGRAARLAPRPFSWGLAAGLTASVALGDSVIPMGIAQRGAALFLLAWLISTGWRLSRT
jgi:hypothetical protein